MIFLLFIYLFICELTNIFAVDTNISLSNELEKSKPGVMFVRNSTNGSATITVRYFYHPDFDEEDFISNINTTMLFSPDYKIEHPGNGQIIYTDKKGFSSVCVSPYRDRSSSTAIILQNSVEVPLEGIMVEGPEGSYVGGMVSEDLYKFVSFMKTEAGELSLIIRPAESLCEAIPTQSLSESVGVHNPFFQYFIETVARSHSQLFRSLSKNTRQLNLLKKFQDIHEAGLAYNRAIADQPYVTKTPFILHSFLVGNSRDILENEVLKSNIIKSTHALPNSNWKHFIWTDDPSLVRDALCDIASKIEIKSLFSGDFQDVVDIQSLESSIGSVNISDLIAQRKYDYANTILKYKVLLKFGGVVRSSNARVVQDLAPLHNFGFYAGLNLNFPLLSLELFAACPNHLIIKRALELAIYHHNSGRSIRYLTDLRKSFRKEHLTAEHYFGCEAPLTLAFYQHAASTGEDMLFDASVLSQDSNIASSRQAYVINKKN